MRDNGKSSASKRFVASSCSYPSGTQLSSAKLYVRSSSATSVTTAGSHHALTSAPRREGASPLAKGRGTATARSRSRWAKEIPQLIYRRRGSVGVGEGLAP